MRTLLKRAKNAAIYMRQSCIRIKLTCLTTLCLSCSILSVCLSQGAGAFQPARDHSLPGDESSLSILLLCASHVACCLSVCLSQGAGAFQPACDYPLSGDESSLSVLLLRAAGLILVRLHLRHDVCLAAHHHYLRRQ